MRYKWFILLAVVIAPVAFFARQYAAVDDELMALAAQVQAQCSAQRACPSAIDGWTKTPDGRFRKGNFYYQARGNQAFDLYYHYGPDMEQWVEGGVDRPLKKR